MGRSSATSSPPYLLFQLVETGGGRLTDAVFAAHFGHFEACRHLLENRDDLTLAESTFFHRVWGCPPPPHPLVLICLTRGGAYNLEDVIRVYHVRKFDSFNGEQADGLRIFRNHSDEFCGTSCGPRHSGEYKERDCAGRERWERALGEGVRRGR
jgi:hypothetical protein